jgi:photosystem II stability/assembly factor-like uncharacterized protein
MKKLVLIIFIVNCSLHIPGARDCYAQWIQQTSGVSSSLLDIDFINQNTGWACGDGGVILKTTNGGVNWVQQSSGVSKRLEGIDAINANLLWCAGWWNTILKTTDGGNNWLVIRDGPTSSPTFLKTYFLNANTGWLLKNNYILRTTNAGITYDSTNTVFTFLRDVYFKDAMTGILCGDGALIMKSLDGGVTWNRIQLPLATGAPNLYRISFIDDFGWSIGEGGPLNGGRLVFRTTNFGNTWDSIARVMYPLNELNYSVFFSSLNTGYCGGTNGFMYKTTNGGYNWYEQVITGGAFRRDFCFINDSLGWVIGGGGHIFKTTTGGQFVSIITVSSITPNEHKLQNVFPNPFNPLTTVTFDIAYNDNVKIIIYDVMGRLVKVLVDKKLNAGTYKIYFEASNLSSGVYICQLVTAKTQISKIMMLIK